MSPAAIPQDIGASVRARPDREQGFTLIELAVPMSVLGVLLAMGAPAWGKYKTTQEQRSAAREIVSVLRNAQVHATAEERLYRVDVDATARTLSVFRYDDAGTPQQTKVLS